MTISLVLASSNFLIHLTLLCSYCERVLELFGETVLHMNEL